MSVRTLLISRASTPLLAALIGTSILATGCGSSRASSTQTAATIKSNWSEFFNAKTPLNRRVQLLQNGQQLEPLLQAQASSPLAASSGANVSSLTLTGPSTATVHYNITVSGKPVLSNVTGESIRESNIWKVSEASFCSLLSLQAGGKPIPNCPTSG